MRSGVGSTGVPTERSTIPSVCPRACSSYDVRWSQGKSGSDRETERAAHLAFRVGSFLVLREGQRGDHRVVLVDDTHLGRSARRAEVVEEVDVGGVVVLPLLRCVVLVEDGLHRAHGLARAAVDALVGM